MSVYSLTTASEKAIGMLLTAGGGSETLLLRRPECERRIELHIEPAGAHLEACIAGDGTAQHTLKLQRNDPANAQHLADFIHGIANRTTHIAQAAPVKVGPFDRIALATSSAREPFALNAEDEASLRHLVRIGGTRHLQCGVSVTVHNAGILAPSRHALITTPDSTEHLQAGTPGELYVILAQHIEAALNAA